MSRIIEDNPIILPYEDGPSFHKPESTLTGNLHHFVFHPETPFVSFGHESTQGSPTAGASHPSHMPEFVLMKIIKEFPQDSLVDTDQGSRDTQQYILHGVIGALLT